MGQEVQAGFPDNLDGNGKFVLAVEVILVSGEKHVLATEVLDGLKLLEQIQRQPVRLIGVGIYNLTGDEHEQLIMDEFRDRDLIVLTDEELEDLMEKRKEKRA